MHEKTNKQTKNSLEIDFVKSQQHFDVGIYLRCFHNGFASRSKESA